MQFLSALLAGVLGAFGFGLPRRHFYLYTDRAESSAVPTYTLDWPGGHETFPTMNSALTFVWKTQGW